MLRRDCPVKGLLRQSAKEGRRKRAMMARICETDRFYTGSEREDGNSDESLE